MTSIFKMTEKQIAIMTEVLKGDLVDGFIDIDQLMERLPYKPTKQAIQCSIRFLEEHGMLARDREIRRGRRRMILIPQPLGMTTFRPGPGSGTGGSP